MRRLNPTDARLMLPADVAGFADSDRRVLAVCGPLSSGRARLIQQGLSEVPESEVTREGTSFPDRFHRALKETRMPFLVLTDYNVFNPRSAQGEWYERAVEALVAGGAVEPCESHGGETVEARECRYSGKVILVGEAQADSASLPSFQTLAGIEFADSGFDIHNYVHRIVGELSADDEIETEALLQVLSYLRSLCRSAPEMTTKPDPGASLTVMDLKKACRPGLSPGERQFYVGTDIQQYLLARSAGDERRRNDADAWPSWDYAGPLAVDELRALIMQRSPTRGRLRRASTRRG